MNIIKKHYDNYLKMLVVEFRTENGISAYEFTNEQILEHLFRDFTDTSKLQLIDWFNEPHSIMWARNYFLDDLFVKTLVARRYGQEKAMAEVGKPKIDIWEVGDKVIDEDFGEGEIVDVDTTRPDSIKVKFEDGTIDWGSPVYLQKKQS